MENLIWIGTHDLMQDNVTMTERDKMGLFQTKYSVAILVNSPHKSQWK